jgi:L-asparaginase II
MSSPVVIEVTRGPLVESRHEGAAVVVKPDGTVVGAWGEIDAEVLPRSAPRTTASRATSTPCAPGCTRSA